MANSASAAPELWDLGTVLTFLYLSFLVGQVRSYSV